MNVEKYLKENLGTALANEYVKVYVTPDIPQKKLDAAIASIAPDANPDYVIAVIDSSVFGTGKTGAVVMGDRIYFYNLFDRAVIEYSAIQSTEKSSVTTKDKKGNTVVTDYYFVIYKENEKKCEITDLVRGMFPLFDILTTVVAEDTEEYTSTNQTLPLSMMPDNVKEAYLKFVCNYAYEENQVIDAEEYAEIMTLIVINEVPKNVRLSLRAYMSDIARKEDTKALLELIEVAAGDVSLDDLRLSVMKDVINLYWKRKHDQDWKSCQTLINYKEQLGITDDQVNCLMEAIIGNERILTERQSDLEIKKTMQEMASSTAAVGVPLAAIYLSGSVVGVSAVGMTSGLAALGMGGVLGFSSMFTGLGVAVLLGVGAYKAVQKATGLGDLEKNKQRELMLQQIAKNSQQALNYLVEDLNDLTDQLREAVIAGNAAEVKINRLAAIISTMSNSAKRTTSSINFAKREQLLCKLPMSIDEGTIENLASGASRHNLRDYIFEAYNQVKTDENGAQHTHCLNTELATETLEKLYDIMVGIGYYNKVGNGIASVRSFIGI